MTVESESTDGWSTSTRVVDYRQVRNGNLPTPQQDRMMPLSIDEGSSVTFAEATGEDSVMVYEWNPRTGGRTNKVPLIGPAINDVNLTRFDGLERWIWRETREGDYPEPTLLAQDESGVASEGAFDRFAREVEEEADADPTGEARRQLDGFRDYYAEERRKRREKMTAAEETWGFPAGTGDTAFGLMSDMAGMEEEDQ